MLTQRLASLVCPLIPPGSSVLVGLSGGVDSVVLLHLLRRLAVRYDWQLSALHVHHGISQNADAWAQFCTTWCEAQGIALHIERVDIGPLRAQGIEAAARTLRHAAFAAQSCDFVALAHHSDDQAETLLLQLLRGAGVRGAASMPVLSQVEGAVLSTSKRPMRVNPVSARGRLVRPLLNFTRDDILSYAVAHGLQWIEDESNADVSYPRNFLRHRLLPLLGEKFPSYRETLSRSAQHFAEAAGLLDELASQDALISNGTLAQSALQCLNLPRAKNLLRYFIHQMGAPMPQAVQMEDMLQQLLTAREDAQVCVVFGGGQWQVRRYQGQVHVLRTPCAFDRNQVLIWQGEQASFWPALDATITFSHGRGQGLSAAKLRDKELTLRFRQGGEKLKPAVHAATRTLKNLLQEHHIPPWQRDRLPLLYCANELVFIPGVAIASDFQALPDEAAVLISVSLQGGCAG